MPHTRRSFWSPSQTPLDILVDAAPQAQRWSVWVREIMCVRMGRSVNVYLLDYQSGQWLSTVSKPWDTLDPDHRRGMFGDNDTVMSILERKREGFTKMREKKLAGPDSLNVAACRDGGRSTEGGPQCASGLRPAADAVSDRVSPHPPVSSKRPSSWFHTGPCMDLEIPQSDSETFHECTLYRTISLR
ncbi:hypothetical protein RRG08_008309 [Elysia crispata]|uniref:Uncharacterized protein n=1 Tax=Elysia crispata TaxID=231223 RepID=A0AAE0ZNG0_9GAST|nr:hypothetical protein RRG08_008309 [Elysia crispata]